MMARFGRVICLALGLFDMARSCLRVQRRVGARTGLNGGRRKRVVFGDWVFKIGLGAGYMMWVFFKLWFRSIRLRGRDNTRTDFGQSRRRGAFQDDRLVNSFGLLG